ncbi:TonB-dependent receptor [Pollutimonas sp. H1-120]
MPSRFRPLAAGLALIFSPVLAAQPDIPQDDRKAAAQTLDAITISASPLGLTEDTIANPVETLDGASLVLKREATLGDTLNGMLGVHADTFGAGASRPVIRGQSAPRVKILSDGSELMDASGVSPDHAITSEPMLARRIEVLRGPATLLYGGGAIGGVVNVIDDKIPEAIPEKGVEGYAELRGSTGSNERAAATGITAGKDNFAIHVEGLRRHSDDYKVPDWPDGKLKGSFEESTTGSVGMSWIGSRGFIGVAYTNTRSEYGLPGHNHEYESCHPHGSHLHCGGHDGDDHGHDHEHEHTEAAPFVRLKNERIDVRGEYREPLAGIRKIRVRGGLTDYQHQEIEGAAVATTFKNRSYDARVEFEHEPIAGWRGVFGVQGSRSDFSALGEESFLPKTITKNLGVFLLEEYRLSDWRFEVGARQERQSVTPQGTQPRSALSGTSLSTAAIWDFAPMYSLALSVSRSQRLPTAQELYADGIHLATNTYEIGNADLKQETSQNVDLTLRKHAGDARFAVSVFFNQVKNYIYADTLDRHEDFRLIEYAQHDARFMGVEAEASYRFNPYLTASVFGDMVRGKLTGKDGNLPRIPAVRAGVRLQARLGGDWSSNVEAYRVFRQDRLAGYESETPGYNMLNLGIEYDGRAGALDYTAYLRATNLANQQAFNHASFISSAAPLPGRRVMLGLRMYY